MRVCLDIACSAVAVQLSSSNSDCLSVLQPVFVVEAEFLQCFLFPFDLSKRAVNLPVPNGWH